MKNERKLSLVGEQKKEAGLNRVEQSNTEWLDWIRYHAEEIAKWTGRVTTSDLHEVADSMNRHPTHPNAWGAVFRNKKTWERIGYENSKRPDAHYRLISVWKLREKENDQ